MSMADSDDPVQAAARLEAALERIAARAAEPPQPVLPGSEDGEQAARTQELAARLDTLIGQLRKVLAKQGG